jgi:hypothetical protein
MFNNKNNNGYGISGRNLLENSRLEDERNVRFEGPTAVIMSSGI